MFFSENTKNPTINTPKKCRPPPTPGPPKAAEGAGAAQKNGHKTPRAGEGATHGCPPKGGAETSRIKAETARELIGFGCDEIDMVNNIAWLKAGDKAAYVDDVAGVVAAADGRPVKVILECHWLTDEEIARACDWCAEAGAAWVKTGTGWAPTGATVERIALMAKSVAGRCQVKAAGGIRSLATLQALYDAGARRFGVGVNSARQILAEVK